ncbi:DUF547 domain-containing protein, partial [bacterium]|nr:DUF547 domain-containing protein [bacterium]
KKKGGTFTIQPEGSFRGEQTYLKDTNILRGYFTTPTGSAELLDFMPVSDRNQLYLVKRHEIYRCVTGLQGQIALKVFFTPRPGYARHLPGISGKENHFEIKAGKERFQLFTIGKSLVVNPLTADSITIRFDLTPGEKVWFVFRYGEAKDFPLEPAAQFEATNNFWQAWLHYCEAGNCRYFGEHQANMNRSLLALKLLAFQPTGAIAAAATTSLPESLGQERNWDYRFAWLRDSSFTLKALLAMGHISETESFIRWLRDIYLSSGGKRLQIMYSLTGKAQLKEEILGHLAGYQNSKPVRIGNAAYKQKQWDIYGEVMDTAWRLSAYAGRIDEHLWPFFRSICNQAAHDWSRPDDGIWEVRNGPFHFVYSKVMCWVALDRGIKIAQRYGFTADIKRWLKEASRIKQNVSENGYSPQSKSFIQYYGSQNLDASLLLIPLMGFLPITDERVQGTIKACQAELMRDGFLLRYSGQDGLSGKEGGFLLCNFWLIECLTLSGKLAAAQDLLKQTSRVANHLGLFAEEYDTKNKQLLGNFPQAFTHIGYLNATNALWQAQQKSLEKPYQVALAQRLKKLIPGKLVLNSSPKIIKPAPAIIDQELKKLLVTLKGAFFNSQTGKVNYLEMKNSPDYQKYLALAKNLAGFDPFALKSDSSKIAFWLNIYNILIIHGVIELVIQESVKEVSGFFTRIQYRIGPHTFTPDEIEHGILRGNAPHPTRRLKAFGLWDKRRALSVSSKDPRIHFALVCAANSCPPIMFYDADQIEQQLNRAVGSFVNRGGVRLKPEESIIYLSQIFKWYQTDFGGTNQAVLKFILPYLPPEELSDLKIDHLASWKIKYLPYDWNLNREPATGHQF